MDKLRTTLVTAGLALVAAGCGGDNNPVGVNSGDPLTPYEMQLVFNQLTAVFENLGAAPASPGPAAATQSFNESINQPAPCDSGGSITANGSVNGTVDDVTGELDMTLHMRMTPNGCVVETETASITLDGAPYIQMDMDFYLSDTTIDMSGTQKGGISFTSTDGRSGSCAFDISFTGNVNLDTQAEESSVSGTVCGASAADLEVFQVG